MSAVPERPAARLARLVPGLGPLSAPLAAEVEACAGAIGAPDGAVLFDDDSPCTGMLVLESGAVRVSRISEHGRELLLHRVLPGKTCVLTLSCLLGGSRYPARGVADADTSGVFLPAGSSNGSRPGRPRSGRSSSPRSRRACSACSNWPRR